MTLVSKDADTMEEKNRKVIPLTAKPKKKIPARTMNKTNKLKNTKENETDAKDAKEDDLEKKQGSKFFIVAPEYNPVDFTDLMEIESEEPTTMKTKTNAITNKQTEDEPKKQITETEEKDKQEELDDKETNRAILMTLHKLTEIMTENNENTKKIIENKQQQKTEKNEKNKKIKPTEISEQYRQISNSAEASKRINGFSRNLSKDLDNLGMMTNNTNESNTNFLKVMSQNITNAEIRINNNEKKYKMQKIEKKNKKRK